jgi:hypothetical protein
VVSIGDGVRLHLQLATHHAPTGRTRHTIGGEPMKAPAALEIVHRESGYFLLYIDDGGAEMTNTWHSSLDDAKSQAEFEFSVSPDEWLGPGVTATS